MERFYNIGSSWRNFLNIGCTKTASHRCDAKCASAGATSEWTSCRTCRTRAADRRRGSARACEASTSSKTWRHILNTCAAYSGNRRVVRAPLWRGSWVDFSGRISSGSFRRCRREVVPRCGWTGASLGLIWRCRPSCRSHIWTEK